MSTLSLLVSPVSHVFCVSPVSPSAPTIFWCLLLWMISFQPRIINVFPFFSGWSDKFSGVSVYFPSACPLVVKPQNPNLSRQNTKQDFQICKFNGIYQTFPAAMTTHIPGISNCLIKKSDPSFFVGGILETGGFAGLGID